MTIPNVNKTVAKYIDKSSGSKFESDCADGTVDHFAELKIKKKRKQILTQTFPEDRLTKCFRSISTNLMDIFNECYFS